MTCVYIEGSELHIYVLLFVTYLLFIMTSSMTLYVVQLSVLSFMASGL